MQVKLLHLKTNGQGMKICQNVPFHHPFHRQFQHLKKGDSLQTETKRSNTEGQGAGWGKNGRPGGNGADLCNIMNDSE